MWIVDVDDARGEATAAEVGATYRHLDVRDEAAWSALVDEIVAADGQLDVLVNNAGIFTYARLVDTSVDDFTRQFDVNQLGVFLGMRAVAPTMIAAQRGQHRQHLVGGRDHRHAEHRSATRRRSGRCAA